MKCSQTKNLVIWLRYWVWCFQFWLSGYHWCYPMWLRQFFLEHVVPDRRRHCLSRRYVKSWEETFGKSHPLKPMPWWIGPHAIGPFCLLRDKVLRFFRRVAKLSHRCEFTDPERGALYTGRIDPFMNRLFERFIQNISREINEIERLEAWAESVRN